MEKKRFFTPEKTYSYEKDMESLKHAGVLQEAFQYGEANREKEQGKYTLEDYYALPEDVRAELIDGYLFVMDSPTTFHQSALLEIAGQIRSFIRDQEGSCMVFVAPVDVQLDCDDRTMVVPDILILCDRDKLTRKCIVGAPDFILEVLSPSTGYKDSTLKLQKYAAAGVKEYWLLDPDKEKLLVYDFAREQNPTIYGLTGKVPVGIYGGKLQIDLDLVREYGLDIFD